MEIHSLPPERLTQFIDRIRKFDIDQYETYLHTIFVSVLSELSEFVPSEGIMVLVDDPKQRRDQRKDQELTYVATLGPSTKQLLGRHVLATTGVIGETYTLGKSYVRKANASERLIIDKFNFQKEIRNLISVPLKIETANVGVLLVYNKNDPIGFTIRDLKLVEIFGAYISTSLQNAIDARKSKELSKRDDLTGLFNDRYFHRQLETEIKKADDQRYPLTLMFLDLDNFKAVNDHHGHLVGSQTLKEVGFILREAVALDHATLARYGGDEYVVILPGIDLQGAMEIGERIRMMIVGKLFMIDQGDEDGSFVNFKGLISCSIGIASLHEHVPSGASAKSKKNHLLKMADQAMYRAKENGKNCLCVAETTTQTSQF